MDHMELTTRFVAFCLATGHTHTRTHDDRCNAYPLRFEQMLGRLKEALIVILHVRLHRIQRV